MYKMHNNTKNNYNALNIEQQQTRLYIFPPITQIPSVYHTLEEINTVMDMALKDHNDKSIPSNKIQKTMILRQTQTGAIMRCRIRGCGAYLTFTKRGNNYYIESNDLEHEHYVKSIARGRLPKAKNWQVQECYDELQLLNFKPREIIDFIKNKFKISKPHFNSIKFCRNKRQNIRNLLMALSKYDHFFFQCKDMRELVAHYKNQKFPDNIAKERDVILLVSRRMRQLYDSYHGQYVYFSLFPDIVLETRYTKNLQYHNLGVLYGQDAKGTLTLMFGLAIIRKSVRLSYLYILEKLFTFLGKYPKVIVTDFDNSLAEAVRRLRDRCKVQGALRQHIQLPNNFMTSHNIQTRVNPQFMSYLSSDLELILRDTDYKSHQDKLKKIYETNITYNHQSSMKITEEIQKYVRANSIIHLQPLFIGLTLSPYSSSVMLKSRVLDFFKSPRPMILAVKAFFQIFKLYPVLRYLSYQQIQARINPPKQSSLKAQKIQLLQMISKQMNPKTKIKYIMKALSYSPSIFFYDTLQQCFRGEIQLVENGGRHFYRVVETDTSYPYTIKKVTENINGQNVALWRCDCKVYFKTGMPCWHEIKTCLCEGVDVSVQFNPYWFVDAKPLQPSAPRPVTEHDMKHWPQSDSFNRQHIDREPSQKIVEEVKANQRDQARYFEYSSHALEEHVAEKGSQKGIGEIMQQLQVLQWQVDSVQSQGSRGNNKKEEQSAGVSANRSVSVGSKQLSMIEDLKKLQYRQDVSMQQKQVNSGEQQLQMEVKQTYSSLNNQQLQDINLNEENGSYGLQELNMLDLDDQHGFSLLEDDIII